MLLDKYQREDSSYLTIAEMYGIGKDSVAFSSAISTLYKARARTMSLDMVAPADDYAALFSTYSAMAMNKLCDAVGGEVAYLLDELAAATQLQFTRGAKSSSPACVTRTSPL